MTNPDPELESRIEARAQQRLASDEARITGSRRTSQSLGQAWSAFWRHPSPWLIGTFLAGSIGYRATRLEFSWAELVVPVALVVLFPVIEWVVHVVILHWRPRRVGGVPVDSLLSRKHREHHADPRQLPLVFIPWQVELWLLPAYVVLALVAFPGATAGASFLVSVGALMFGYEWVHYLVHSDYRPRTRAFRAVWRNHRLHHYKNEHYWFTVTSSGTADRLFGTYPETSTVQTSKTVRDLHALEEGRQESAEPVR
jgi:sterol desaturase/sphingolipid hydroxylase (fatty acid hydroxylase superfamily)